VNTKSERKRAERDVFTKERKTETEFNGFVNAGKGKRWRVKCQGADKGRFDWEERGNESILAGRNMIASLY